MGGVDLPAGRNGVHTEGGHCLVKALGKRNHYRRRGVKKARSSSDHTGLRASVAIRGKESSIRVILADSTFEA